jgi:hypothetical protein
MSEALDIISTYTRKQAIEDGQQREVTVFAKEEGFKFRVFLTQNAWAEAVRVPEGVICQDERGRLHDVFWMLHCAIKAMKKNDSLLWFSVKVRVGNAERAFKTVKLMSQCGPVDIDDPAPSLTIMMPEDY